MTTNYFYNTEQVCKKVNNNMSTEVDPEGLILPTRMLKVIAKNTSKKKKVNSSAIF